ncbi:MAG: MATE family efflux transporter [bacterium]
MGILRQDLNELENKELWKVFFKYFTCGLIFYFILQLENITIPLFLGQMGREVFFSFTTAQPILQLIFSIGIVVGIGGSVLVSIKLGQNRRQEAEKVLGNSIVLLIIISLVVLLLALVFKDYLPIRISGYEKGVFFRYFISRLSGITFYVLASNLILFLIAAGNPFKALSVAFLSQILKVIAVIMYKGTNSDLVYLGILLNLVDLLVCVFILKHFIQIKTGILKLEKEDLKPGRVSLTILAIGVMPWLLVLVKDIYNHIIFNNFTIMEHDELVSYSMVRNYIYSLFFLFINALSWIRPIFSYNYGKENFNRIKILLQRLAIIVPVVIFLLFIPVMFYGKSLISIFVGESSMLGPVKDIFKYSIIILPLTGFASLVFIYLQATAKKLKLLIVYLSNIIFLIIPLILLTKYHFNMNLDKLMIINTTVAVLMFIITAIVVVIDFWNLNKIKQSSTSSGAVRT